MNNRRKSGLAVIILICGVAALGCAYILTRDTQTVVASEVTGSSIKLYIGEMIQIQSMSYGNSFLIYRGLDIGVPQFSCMIIPVSTERNVVVFDINYQSNMSFHILRAYTVVEEFFVKEYTSSFVLFEK